MTMRFECPNDWQLITPETCLQRQEAWEDGRLAPCGGNDCSRFVCDSLYGSRERLIWICRMETDRQTAERKDPPPAIGA
jgi:hypothetical protein